MFARAGKDVTLWARDPAKVAEMEHSRENPRLKGVALPDNLRVTHEMPGADILLLAVPMQYLRGILPALPRNGAPLVLCCKGLETGTLLLPPELVMAALPRC